MHFEIVGQIEHIETIATGRSIHDIKSLKKKYGAGRWRKLKGIAAVRLGDGNIRKAEVHWYEAHGIGRRKMKIKAFLDLLWRKQRSGKLNLFSVSTIQRMTCKKGRCTKSFQMKAHPRASTFA